SRAYARAWRWHPRQTPTASARPRTGSPRGRRSQRPWSLPSWKTSSCPSWPWRAGLYLGLPFRCRLARRGLVRGVVDVEPLLLARDVRGRRVDRHRDALDLADELAQLTLEMDEAFGHAGLLVERVELAGEPVHTVLEAVERLLDAL